MGSLFSAHTTPAGRDPRDMITPYAFGVDPELLGTPLATPWKRLVALGIDFALAGLVAHLGGVLVGLAVAFVFFRIATRRRVDHPVKRWARGAAATVGALVLFGTALALVGPDTSDDPPPAAVEATQQPVEDEVAQVQHETANAQRIEGVVDSLEQAAKDGHLSTLEMLAVLPAALAAADQPAAADTLAARDSAQVAALLQRYARAYAAGDSAVVARLRPQVARIAAGEQLAALQSDLAASEARTKRVRNERDRLREELNTVGLWATLKATADDFGITFGWIGLYFTLFLAWWGGRTPGKRLMGLQVVRLSGQPLTLWHALERFGGYAAGVATGLIGFAQVFWDPNRQAIHDRVAGTVVIDTARPMMAYDPDDFRHGNVEASKERPTLG
ncbi:RDD family protein [Salisaeta longa]|uniref:RDD family protein n=1 Tax=Salisaeta longa TaxID=503170 RepID=UPI0003B3CF76|nr:RDD family protein [Salisaeta longa]